MKNIFPRSLKYIHIFILTLHRHIERKDCEMKEINVIVKTVLSVIVAMSVCGCVSNNAKKPLVGGIRPSGQHVERIDVDSKAPAEECEEVQLEMPAPIKNKPEQILRRIGYTVSYNKDTRLPNWVAWHLTADRLQGNAKRQQKAFHEDEDVAEPRATDWDYYNSRYDRGHMCPAGDNKWSKEAMWQSFLFTNICPQNPNLNRGDWNEMENMCRKWAREYGDIYVVCGPVLYKGRHKTIGKNKVTVPEGFFKVVLCMRGTPKAIGFIYKNAAGNRPKGDYVNSVDEVERITGYDFFPALPDKVERKVEAKADAKEWGL